MTNYLFLLGADDPEMRRIEELLHEWHGVSVWHTTKDGKRVHPGNAYQADPIEIIGIEQEELVLVECEPVPLPENITFHRIDHHRPGDPGYGLPASQYLEASSLGQVAHFLGITMALTHDDLVLAAMDHCPAAAIRGECPGVSDQDVFHRKSLEISKATGATFEEVHERVVYFQAQLENAPEVVIGEQTLKDLRGQDTGSGYSLDYLCSQVATLASGEGVLLLTHDRGDTRKKWTIAGHCTPQCVEAFIAEWGPAQGLTGIYGVPNRGYAGGYLPV